MNLLKQIQVSEVPSSRRHLIDADTLSKVSVIVERVRQGGRDVLVEYAQKFGDWHPEQPLIWYKSELQEALSSLPSWDQELLHRCAERVRRFAQAQRISLLEMELEIPGGRAGHTVLPVERAGCYAPGGRFPLPSSVIMTAMTARVAGVSEVWVASPKPTPMTLAAAAVAEADALLAVGGAQAIAALAFGAGEVPACDVVVGPGNRWVTAAKQLVSGYVAIDMLAGPSELVIFADSSADPRIIAADLLAQAEHDTDALPVLITLDAALVSAVHTELSEQLQSLPTADIASAALNNGFVVVADSLEQGIRLCDQMAPEHLQLLLRDAKQHAPKFQHYGGLFIGQGTAEVLGDYCTGPNHTLPTGGTARFRGGLSVHQFLRIRTWMRIDHPEQAETLVRDAVELARHEGLEAHARAAEERLSNSLLS